MYKRESRKKQNHSFSKKNDFASTIIRCKDAFVSLCYGPSLYVRRNLSLLATLVGLSLSTGFIIFFSARVKNKHVPTILIIPLLLMQLKSFAPLVFVLLSFSVQTNTRFQQTKRLLQCFLE